MLKWICERLDGKAQARETAIGLLPTYDGIDLSGLSLSPEAIETLLSVDEAVWREEAALIPPHYQAFGDRLPKALWEEHADLVRRLDRPAGAKLAAARGPQGARITAVD